MIEPGAGGPAEEQRYRDVAGLDPERPESLERLLEALYDESWRVRKAAAERIPAMARAERATPRLLEILADRGQTGARNAAADALARLAPQSTSSLLELLRHPDPDQRKFAADILGEARDPTAAPELVKALSDGDRNVQLSAAEALARVGGDEARRALEGLLGVDDPMLRLAGLDGLAALRHAPPLPSIIPLLDEPALRRSAFRVLGLVAEPWAIERICRALSDRRRGVREAAMVALGMRGAGHAQLDVDGILRANLRSSPDLLEAVRAALESESTHLKIGALVVTGALKEVSLAPAVAEVARDDALAAHVTGTLERLGAPGARILLSGMTELSAPARAVAAEAMVPLADPSLVEALALLARSEEPELELFAIKALGRSHSQVAIPVLVELLDSPAAAAAGRALVALADPFHADVQAALEAKLQKGASPAAVFALARVGGRGAEQHLLLTLKDPDPAVRAASAEAASSVGGHESLELLRLALTDEAPVVRAAAARALGRLEPETARKLLHTALQDEDASVQGAAIEAAAEAQLGELAPQICGAVESRNPYLASRAVRALARLGRFDEPAMAAALRHPDPEVLKEALGAGAALPSAAALARPLLTHARWDVRSAAARLLAVSGSREQVVELERALGGEADPYARQVMTDALERLRRR